MIPKDIRLYSWVDVEEVFLKVQKDEPLPDWLVWAEAYWDSLTLGIRPDTRNMALEWLCDKFDPRFDKKELAIKLESVNEDKIRKLDVLLEETTGEVTPHHFVPSFARPMVIQPAAYTQEHPISLDPDLPPVVAFHSFKGGVGRTLHALALALAMVKKGSTSGYVVDKSVVDGPPLSVKRSRVLIVDADLEAPGFSWLISKKLSAPPISFVDFLSLVHGDPDPSASESIDLVANRLRDALVDGIYILPAFRSSSKFNSLEIRPEHLTRGSKDSFILTTLLSRLGKALNVDAVIVDLRAGISELSSGLLLDPRVYRVLVTTLSGQSMKGTCQLLELLGELAPSKKVEDPIPALILSQIPHEYEKDNLLDPYYERLLEASKNIIELSDNNLTENQVDDPTILVNYFESILQVLPDEWDEVVTRIHKSDLIEEMSDLINWLPEVPSEKHRASDRQPDLKKQRRELEKYAKQLIYAEAGKIGDFLAINPLHNLASNFSAHVPIAIIIGAKGSGKTYTYLQISQRKNWSEFARSAGSEDIVIDAFISPILKSRNLEDPADKVVSEARVNSSKELGLSNPCDMTNISDYLRDGLKKDMHEGQWREYWLNILAWSLGFEVNEDGAGRRFVDYLRERKKHVVAIIDGLEDFFLQVSSDRNEQTAVRSLLQDVPEWLKQQPSRPIGLLVFIRQDIVINAIKQNYSQLMANYDAYSLKWNAEEALRLVTWIVMKANVLDINSEKDLRKMNTSKLTTQLISLWGRKLGSEKSREARSANWVITALSDLKGQIQARDVVRFLYIASKASGDDTHTGKTV